jgi:hypothetical protein
MFCQLHQGKMAIPGHIVIHLQNAGCLTVGENIAVSTCVALTYRVFQEK